MTPAKFNILVSKSAEKALLSLPKKEQQRVILTIQALSDNPFPIGSRKLQGEASIFRVRVGHYRIIYEVDGKRVIIIVLKIGHRKDIYR